MKAEIGSLAQDQRLVDFFELTTEIYDEYVVYLWLREAIFETKIVFEADFLIKSATVLKESRHRCAFPRPAVPRVRASRYYTIPF